MGIMDDLAVVGKIKALEKQIINYRTAYEIVRDSLTKVSEKLYEEQKAHAETRRSLELADKCRADATLAISGFLDLAEGTISDDVFKKIISDCGMEVK